MTDDERKALRALCDSLRPLAERQVFPGGYDLYDPWWCAWRQRAQAALLSVQELLRDA